MELWIRTQDRESLLPMGRIDIDHSFGKWCLRLYGFDVLIGYYDTKKRALEILDEIQSKFKPKVIIKNLYTMDDENFKKAKEGLNYIQAIDKETNLEFISNDVIVYEMPQK